MLFGKILRNTCLVLLAFVCLQVNAQNGVVRFKECLVDAENVFDHIIPTKDGKYFAYGKLYNGTNRTIFAKYDAQLNVIWEKGSTLDLPGIAETPDGGFITCSAGYNPDHLVGSDLLVIKYDQDFNKVWQKTYGGNGNEEGVSVTVMPDGKLIVFAHTNSTDGDIIGKTTVDHDIWALLLDASGNILNQKLFGGPTNEFSARAIVTNDGGLLLTINTGGIPGNHGHVDIWTIKTDASLQIQWSKNVGGNARDICNSVIQLTTGDYVMCGSTLSTSGDLAKKDGDDPDGFLLKMSSSGNVIWSRTMGGTDDDQMWSVTELPGGSLAIAGQSYGGDDAAFARGTDHNYTEGVLLKYNSAGQLLMSRSVGAQCDELLHDVVLLPNGNYLVCGVNFYCSTGGDFSGGPRPALGGSRAFMMEIRDLSTIKGKAYFDNNNNAVFDAGDTGLEYGKVSSTKENVALNWDLPTSADFFISVDTGIYTTKLNYSTYYYDPALYAVAPKKKVSHFTSAGQVDSFNFRVVPIGLVEDLQVSVKQLNPAFIDNDVKLRININNNSGKVINTAMVKLKLDSNVLYRTADKQVYSIVGDTLTWQFLNFPGGARDSIEVILHVKKIKMDIESGDSLRFDAYATPILTDFNPEDNVVKLITVVKPQSHAVNDVVLQLTGSTIVRRNQMAIQYITYDFISQLDSTKGAIIFFKDPRSNYVTASLDPDRISGDTLIWYINNLHYNNRDTIFLALQVADTAPVGDYLRHEVLLQLNLIDTVLYASKILQQRIAGVYVAPDMTTTTLQPPHGITWVRLLGEAQRDAANDVLPLPDNGFITVGSSGSKEVDYLTPTGTLDAVIARFDGDGHLKWQKKFGGSLNDELLAVNKLNDSIFYACGYSSLPAYQNGHAYIEAWAVKFNDKGDTLWKRTFGGSNEDIAYSIAPTADGGCIFTGTTTSADGDVTGYVTPTQSNSAYYFNAWVVKLDAAGTMQWNKCYTDTVHGYLGMDIRVAGNNAGYWLGGSKSGKGSPGPNIKDGLLLKLDNSGNTLWEKTYHHSNYQYEIRSIQPVSDSTFMIAGLAGDASSETDTSYHGAHGSNDVWVAMLDTAGAVKYEKYFGGSSIDQASRIRPTSDGGFIVAAETYSANGNVTNQHGQYPVSDAWLLKIDNSGQLQWQKTVGGSNMDKFYGVTELKDKNLIAVGYTASNGDGDIYGNNGQRDALIVKIGQVNFITGKVFVDLNGNHLQDAGEQFYNRGMIRAVRGEINAAGSVQDGVYKISVDTGTYALKLIVIDSAYFTIYSSVSSITFDNYLQTQTVDYALVPIGDVKDLRVDLLPLNAARAGFGANYQLKYENNSPFPINQVAVSYVIDPRATFQSASVPYTERRGDTLIWKFNQLAAFEKGAIDVHLSIKTPPDVMPGAVLSLQATIAPVTGDLSPANNISRLQQPVGVSYDPNDKTEVHGPSLPFNIIQEKDYLNYIIRFQNTGTDTAFNVYVRDTLSNKLDWNTLEVINASHDYDLKIQDDNKLEWEFKNILLPDSNVNEPGSHGFIAYRIKPKANLLVGDTINNTASIYFDFNPPVQTNTAKSIVSPFVILSSHILAFDAKWNNQQEAQLNWKVTNEVNVAYYSIQRASDGIHFTEVGKLPASNVSGILQYFFSDRNPLPQKNYYRLEIIDLDHRSAFSKTVLLQNATRGSKLVISPNPANGKVKLSIRVPVKGLASITIIDSKGTVVVQSALGYINLELWQQDLLVNKLPVGIYTIKCRIGDQVFTGKLIKE